MFTNITLKNFRSHKDSSISLDALTLLIGANNSGKSNFLSGLHYFSRLVSLANPSKVDNTEDMYELRSNNYYPNKHSLANDDEPILFSCVWQQQDFKIFYEINLFPDKSDSKSILCTEKILFNDRDEISQGFDKKTSKLLLRRILEENSNKPINRNVVNFFRDLASFHYYNFQPTFLKSLGIALIYQEGRPIPQKKKDYIRDFREKRKTPFIPMELGREGSNLQELLKFIKEYDEETYNRFIGYLKRFVKNFNGLLIKDDELKWQFDMGGSNFPYYEPEKISDGMVKAAAVALLCSLRHKPSLIMIEEVENGINQRKLSEFLSWLVDTSDEAQKTQFILTSHSPSVIREFSDKLDCVYNVHLRERDYVSKLTNLNDAIKPLVDMGTVEEDRIIKRKGKNVVIIKPYNLTELFYNGVLGEL